MARTSWSTSTARSCSERLPHPPRSVRLASRRSLCARQCSRVGDFRHFVTAITGGGWVLCEVKALSHGTKGQSNGYHRFGYYRRDRIRRLVGLYGCAVEGWERGCLCGVGSDLTACDYVALASRRNTGRILTDIAASEPLVIRPPRSARLAASARASERRSLRRSALTTPAQDWLQTTNVWRRETTVRRAAA
jgi:flagellar hook protein FlgE